MSTMDSTDLAILDELRRDARTSVSEVATRVGISRANAYARVKRLVDSRVIQGFTIDVDHAAQVGFAGYVRVTDRLGGIDMPSDQGIRHFTGAQAEHYSTSTADTSIAAGRANQEWLKAMLTSAMTPGVLLNPFTMIGLLKDTKPNLVLDDEFTNGGLRSLLWRSRHLRPSSIRFLTAPSTGYAARTLLEHTTKPDGTKKTVRTRIRVLLPDLAGLKQLGAAVRSDNDSGIAVFDN